MTPDGRTSPPLRLPPRRGALTRRARARRTRRDATLALELYLALRAGLWGVWLVLPWATFDVAPALYAPFVVADLSLAASEIVWGLVGIIAGIYAVNAAAMRDRRGRAVAAAVLFVIFASIFLAFWSVDPSLTSSPVYGPDAAAALALAVSHAKTEAARLWRSLNP